MSNSPTFEDVARAAERIEGYAHRTPVLRSKIINELVGADVVFKCENFQRVGAFKFRGAFNALSRFSPEQKKRGVVAYSSGNHAQGIALGAKILEMPVAIVMPHDAVPSKIDATRGYGADIVFYDKWTERREEIAAVLSTERGMTVIPSFDHPDIIAGQGTATKELLEEVGELDALFVPLGGGGLLAGACLSANALSPDCKLYGVEPEAGNDGQQSLRKGERVEIELPDTIADGASTPQIGAHNFDIIRGRVADIITATDNELIETMKLFASFMKIVVEPTGCLGLAGARASSALIRGQRIGVVISGGNVDLQTFALLLSTNTSR